VPTIEQIIGSQNIHKVGILGTTQTIQSGSYQREIQKHRPDIQVFGQACPTLCGLIEDNSHPDLLDEHILKYLSLLPEDLDALLLGCTHYEIIADQIQKHLPAKTILFEQPKIVAKSLVNYLQKHPEIESKLEKQSQNTFLTSCDPKQISQTASLFFDTEINFHKLTDHSQKS
jgi:glutamate racemase